MRNTNPGVSLSGGMLPLLRGHMKKFRTFLLICAIITLTLPAVVLVVPGSAWSDTLTFDFTNDYFAPNGKDRWLTNDFALSVESGSDAWTLRSQMYTPRDKRAEGPPENDRPWDGYTYFGRKLVLPSEVSDFRWFEGRVGALGRASGSEVLQDFIHNDLGFGSDPSWSVVNSSRPALELIYGHTNVSYVESLLTTGELTQSYGVRVGNVINEIFLDQEIRKTLNSNFYLLLGMRGSGVLYNTFLDGRLFGSDEYTVERIPFVAQARAGFGFRINSVGIEYIYQYLTEEFKGQDGRHLFGSIALSYSY